MASTGPRSEVFTTVLVNEHGEVAHWPAHRQRLACTLSGFDSPFRMRTPKSTHINRSLGSCSHRFQWGRPVRCHPPPRCANEDIDAISFPPLDGTTGPTGQNTGTGGPTSAKQAAEDTGCDAALLVHDYAIVDVSGHAVEPWIRRHGMDGARRGGRGGWRGPKQLEQWLPDLGLPVVRELERTNGGAVRWIGAGWHGHGRVSRSLDGVQLRDSRALSTACHTLLSQHFTDEAWSTVGPHHVGMMAIVECLKVNGLLGEAAFRFGAPDRVLLVSGGPVSHLAQWSLIAAPATKRVVVRQPARCELPAAEPITRCRAMFAWSMTERCFRLAEEWKHGSWYHSVTLHASGLDDLFNKLGDTTAQNPFERAHEAGFLTDRSGRERWPDLVQWTQPLRLQHLRGAVLAVLWCVEGGVVVDHAVTPFFLWR